VSTEGKMPSIKKFLLNVRALLPYFVVNYLRKADPVESKIVFVLSFPRSGTHAIGSLLSNDQAGFHYYGEFFIFNAWNKNIEKINRHYPFFSFRYSQNLKQQRKKWSYNKFETTSLDSRKTLSAIKKIPGVHVIKICPQHLPDKELESLISEFKPHIIFLRRNHLDRFVSHKKANASGKWHTASTSDLVINLDAGELNRFISDFTDFYTHYARYAKSQGCHILDVPFEDLHNPDKVREIQSFAAFPGFSDWDKLTLAPTTVKQDRSNKVQEDFLVSMNKSYSDFIFPKVLV